MQLKQLKIAGFKSFVEPTTVPFPSSLVAVVGPNGCGKSNIIDAVRWVTGESSAKNLRGDSMTDVIFNGSTNRKPVGQASVELVFDNSLGRLGGQYTAYQEIAVKRVVTRDGESFYYLNGTRCRRRDITDIFLGTGAGARGYSIIGQGTISKIVEAKPEELRAFLEEAAGISKYKERRRETMLRITHTRENLARVTDIRNELDKQLQRLERQAKAAERYQILKEEEKQCKAEILVLKWLAITEEQQILQDQISGQTAILNDYQTTIAATQNEILVTRDTLQEENANYQNLQNHFYQLGTEIVRLEENSLQQQKTKERLIHEQQQLQQDWQTLNTQVEEDKQKLINSEENLTHLQHAWKMLQEELQDKQQNLQLIQNQKNEWQQHWANLQVALATATREVDVEQMRLQQLKNQIQQTQLRLEKINQEQTLLKENNLASQLEGQMNALMLFREQFSQHEDDFQCLLENQHHLRQNLTEQDSQLNHYQKLLQQAVIEQATLAAQIKAATPRHHEEVPVNLPRLFEVIKVEPQWQQACETVLGSTLYAGVIDSLTSLWPQFTSDHPVKGELVSQRIVKYDNHLPRLVDKIKGILPGFCVPLEKIITAESVEEALNLIPQIQEDESIITSTGFWLNKHWLRVPAAETNHETNLLAMQQRLTDVGPEIEQIQIKIQELEEQRHNQLAQLQAQEQGVELARQKGHELRQHIQECEIAIKASENQLQQQQNQQRDLDESYQECLLQLDELAESQALANENLNEFLIKLKTTQDEQAQLEATKQNWENQLQHIQQHFQDAQTAVHQNELQREREQQSIQQLKSSLVRDEGRLAVLQDRLELIAEQLTLQGQPETQPDDTLLIKREQQAEFEHLLQQSRSKVQEYNQQLEQQESRMRKDDQSARAIQEKIQQHQLNLQTLSVKAAGFLENLQELNVVLNQLLPEINQELSLTEREQQLQTIVEKIHRLGAINLAAIEEYDLEAKRKNDLDEQFNDLNEALTNLEAAIEKMDKETRTRLKNTFDEVNSAFQTLFPRLFGGGRAMLELTCDNLLEAGVIVMAQPPGKRNSTIHLLSGGEKAMTAVALVFAIFQLNPSPFCMLDEVDAPLDDVNVGRFCALVKEMSQFVQFLFITHNKVTMELADHLIGVTMREPGVSRIVAVDVEQALALVDA